MTTLAVLQPSYLPWVGFFDQMKRADMFVLLDDVQYTKNDWRNRNRIKTARGPEWLTIPVFTSGKFGQPINEVKIKNDGWRNNHLAKIKDAYRDAPFFEEVYEEYTKSIICGWDDLIDILIESIGFIREWLEIETPVIPASSLDIAGEKTDRLIRICEAFGADRYLSGDAAKAYLDVEKMGEKGIVVEWQEYVPKRYPQLHGEFLPFMSTIDLLFNTGRDAKEYI